MDDAVRDYIDAHAAEFFLALKEWLRIPSVSADPARSADVRRSAAWLAGHLRATGFQTTEIWETGTPDQPGLPAVFAQWTAAGLWEQLCVAQRREEHRSGWPCSQETETGSTTKLSNSRRTERAE